jgi:protein TonB
MTTISPFSTSVGAQSTGWITSLLLHATLAFGAFVFTQQLNLAPQPDPFKWNVAMVEPTAPNTKKTAVPSAEPAATPEKPRRKSMPALTSQTKPLRAMPIPSPLSLPSSVSRQSASELRPASPTPVTPTPPVPSEPIAQDRTVVRTIEPASQKVRAESAPAPTSQLQEPERESLPQTHESTALAALPPEVSHQSSVTDPTPSTAAIEPVQPQAASEQQQIAMATVPSPTRTDYGWLSDTILRRVEELKRYPSEARLDRAEGKVVLKVVIRGDGSVDDVEVYQSSGYRSLDRAAVELLRLAAPFQLPRPLGKLQLTVKIPMNYRLEQ